MDDLNASACAPIVLLEQCSCDKGSSARPSAHDVHADLLACWRRRRRARHRRGGPGDEHRGEDVLGHGNNPPHRRGSQCSRSAAMAAALQLPYPGCRCRPRLPRRRRAHQRRRKHASRQRRRGEPINHGIVAAVAQTRRRRHCPYRRELAGQQLELEPHQLTSRGK
jgi:hypothetical protein